MDDIEENKEKHRRKALKRQEELKIEYEIQEWYNRKAL